MASYFIDEEFIANYPNGFEDEFGNRIICHEVLKNVKVSFQKNCTNNTITIAKGSRLQDSSISCNSHGGVFSVGHHNGLKGGFKAYFRLGYQSQILIGNNTTSTAKAVIVASEMAKIMIGDDCMFASENQLRAEDAHAIYDVRDGKRLNYSKDIVVGNHVWLAFGACLMSGTQIKDGCVVGFKSLVRGKFPNNCTIAGTPAKVIRKHIAWERPAIFNHKYEPADTFKSESRSIYWKETEEDFLIENNQIQKKGFKSYIKKLLNNLLD